MSERKYRRKKLGNIELHPETLMMSYGYDPFLSEGAVKPPIFLTSTFAFKSAEDGAEFFDIVSGRKPADPEKDTGLIYSRFNHPNLQIAEDRLSLFEHGEDAAVFSSGMAAISTTLLSLVKSGEVILHSDPLYGGTQTLIDVTLSSLNLQAASFHDGLSSQSIMAGAVSAQDLGKVAIIFLETPANPTNALIDFELVVDCAKRIAEKQGTRPIIICDNTLLGPIFQQPLLHGVDVVIYSLTKYIGGHSDLVAGAAIGEKPLIQRIRKTRSAFGTQLDPHSSWMIGRSLETVTLRMERAAESGSVLAVWLAKQPSVEKVWHPELIDDEAHKVVYQRQCSGPGSTFSFTLAGGRDAAFAFINRLTIFKHAVSLGGTESLVCHPASTTHSGVPQEVRDAAGVSEGLIRVSIGLEHPDDLVADLNIAFG